MARCNETHFHSYSKSKLENTTEVTFDLQEDVDNCKKVMTKNHYAVVGTGKFRRFDKPESRLECNADGCRNSGTEYITPATGAKASASYKLAFNAIDFAAGIVTFYVKAEDAVNLTVTLGSDAEFKDADVYKVAVKKADLDAMGYAMVTVILADVPNATEGSGWSASEAGAYLKIENDKAGEELAISSISVFDSIADLTTGATVKISCLSEITNDITAEVTEETCGANTYDTSSDPSLEVSITGTMVSGDLWKLNPYAKRGQVVEAFTINTASLTATAVDGYATVTIADHFQSECGFFGVQIDDACDAGKITLERVQNFGVLDPKALTPDQFMVKANEDGSSTVYVNAEYSGHKILVSYPKTVDTEEIILSKDALGTRRARVAYPQKMSDGTEYNMVYNNVLVTSFPGGYSSDSNDIAITLRLLPDADGVYGHQYKVLG